MEGVWNCREKGANRSVYNIYSDLIRRIVYATALKKATRARGDDELPPFDFAHISERREENIQRTPEHPLDIVSELLLEISSWKRREKEARDKAQPGENSWRDNGNFFFLIDRREPIRDLLHRETSPCFLIVREERDRDRMRQRKREKGRKSPPLHSAHYRRPSIASFRERLTSLTTQRTTAGRWWCHAARAKNVDGRAIFSSLPGGRTRYSVVSTVPLLERGRERETRTSWLTTTHTHARAIRRGRRVSTPALHVRTEIPRYAKRAKFAAADSSLVTLQRSSICIYIYVNMYTYMYLYIYVCLYYAPTLRRATGLPTASCVGRTKTIISWFGGRGSLTRSEAEETGRDRLRSGRRERLSHRSRSFEEHWGYMTGYNSDFFSLQCYDDSSSIFPSQMMEILDFYIEEPIFRPPPP